MDKKPDSAKVCSECGNGQNTDASIMGRFMKNGKEVYAHLSCAKLFAIDQWAEAGE